MVSLYEELDALARNLGAAGVEFALCGGVARSCGFTLSSLPRVSKVVGSDVLMLDFLLAEDALRPVWESRERLPWREGTLPVVSRAALVSMKLAAGRPQDLADLARLQESE
jgi:hypothetical protein